MRVGILTFPKSPSHGASLQMYALYHMLRAQKNVDVEIIHYVPGQVIHKRTGRKSLRDKAVSLVSSFFVKSSKPSFQEFEEQVKMYPQEPISTGEQLRAISGRYDRIIVGSDQVWNPVITDHDMNYYLEFSDRDEQKASYAPSFGVAHIAREDREKVAGLLSRFTYLSARETVGKQMIRELTGRDVPTVLDPTMLVTPDTWREQKKPVKLPGRKYVLYYTIKPSPGLRQFAQEFADRNGYVLITIGGRLREFLDPGKHPVSGVGPGEFLSLIDGAEYVVTNSFHGTAFSIILHKNFYVEYSSDTNSRLTNIVETFGLYGSVVEQDTLEKPPVQIDYARVDRVLEIERERSLDYLNGIVMQ